MFARLLRTADVLVENYRPGTLEKFGFGWDDVHSTFPKLVWVSVSGYGRNGPRAGAPAYNSMMQAYTGIMAITGEHDRGPVRCGGSPIDIATAYLAWGSIIAGIHPAAKAGEGMLLEVSLMKSALGFMHAYLQANSRHCRSRRVWVRRPWACTRWAPSKQKTASIAWSRSATSFSGGDSARCWAQTSY